MMSATNVIRVLEKVLNNRSLIMFPFTELLLLDMKGIRFTLLKQTRLDLVLTKKQTK